MTALASSSTLELVQDQESMARLIDALSDCDIIGLDTEFHAENRYEPEFMLLQLASLDGRCWVIDPKEISLYDLGQALHGIEVITHGGQIDVLLLRNHLGYIPERLFDTQIAAAFLNEHYPMRLDSLLLKRLSITLAKQESLTDWSRRPLSRRQMQYAVDDARALLDLRHLLHEQLVDLDLLQHFHAACIEMRDAALSAPSALQWQEWGGAERLQPSAQRILTRLMAWRERTAKEKGRPVNYILPRSIAYYLARTQPSSKSQLYANRRINRGLIQKHGKELLACVQGGLNDSQSYKMPSGQEKKLATLVLAFADIISERSGIHQSLLMPRPLAESIAMHGMRSCTGWRATIYGSDLQQFLNGNLTISITNFKPCLIDSQNGENSERD